MAGAPREDGDHGRGRDHARQEPKRLRLTVVKGFHEKKEIEKLAKRDLAAGGTIVSDGLSCWPAVTKAGCSHRPMATAPARRPRTGRRTSG
jgi:hypothetical protein